MKTKQLFLVIIPSIIFIFYLSVSCSKNLDEEKNTNNYELNTINFKSTGLTLNEEQKILELAMIDLALNSDIIDIINNIVLRDEYEHSITFAQLDSLCDVDSLDLVDLMESSFINNGGDSTDMDKVSSIITNCNNHGPKDTTAMIYIPFADELNLEQLTPNISKINVFDRDTSLVGYQHYLDTIRTIDITKSIAESNPCWVITHHSIYALGGGGAVSNFEGWPWRRCWCKREGGSACSCTKNSPAWDCCWSSSCGRASFRGSCPTSNWCPGC